MSQTFLMVWQIKPSDDKRKRTIEINLNHLRDKLVQKIRVSRKRIVFQPHFGTNKIQTNKKSFSSFRGQVGSRWDHSIAISARIVIVIQDWKLDACQIKLLRRSGFGHLCLKSSHFVGPGKNPIFCVHCSLLNLSLPNSSNSLNSTLV